MEEFFWKNSDEQQLDVFFLIQESIQDWNLEYELWTSWYFATWFDPLQERTSLIRFLVQREIARGEGKSGLSPKYLLALHASSLYVPWHLKKKMFCNSLHGCGQAT